MRWMKRKTGSLLMLLLRCSSNISSSSTRHAAASMRAAEATPTLQWLSLKASSRLVQGALERALDVVRSRDDEVELLMNRGFGGTPQCDKRLSMLVGEHTEAAADELLQLRAVAAALKRELLCHCCFAAAAAAAAAVALLLLVLSLLLLLLGLPVPALVLLVLLLLLVVLSLVLLLLCCCFAAALAAVAAAAFAAAAGLLDLLPPRRGLELERIGAHRDLQHYQEELLFLQQQVAAAEADLRTLADTADTTRLLQQQQLQQLQAVDSDRSCCWLLLAVAAVAAAAAAAAAVCRRLAPAALVGGASPGIAAAAPCPPPHFWPTAATQLLLDLQTSLPTAALTLLQRLSREKAEGRSQQAVAQEKLRQTEHDVLLQRAALDSTHAATIATLQQRLEQQQRKQQLVTELNHHTQETWAAQKLRALEGPFGGGGPPAAAPAAAAGRAAAAAYGIAGMVIVLLVALRHRSSSSSCCCCCGSEQQYAWRIERVGAHAVAAALAAVAAAAAAAGGFHIAFELAHLQDTICSRHPPGTWRGSSSSSSPGDCGSACDAAAGVAAAAAAAAALFVCFTQGDLSQLGSRRGDAQQIALGEKLSAGARRLSTSAETPQKGEAPQQHQRGEANKPRRTSDKTVSPTVAVAIAAAAFVAAAVAAAVASVSAAAAEQLSATAAVTATAAAATAATATGAAAEGPVAAAGRAAREQQEQQELPPLWQPAYGCAELTGTLCGDSLVRRAIPAAARAILAAAAAAAPLVLQLLRMLGDRSPYLICLAP
ncbi:hypothetical protein ACSSS7_008343 [Eimeria intestinalis]